MQLRTAKKIVNNKDSIRKVHWTDYNSFIKRFELKLVAADKGYTYHANEDKSKELLKPALKGWAFIADNLAK